MISAINCNKSGLSIFLTSLTWETQAQIATVCKQWYGILTEHQKKQVDFIYSLADEFFKKYKTISLDSPNSLKICHFFRLSLPSINPCIDGDIYEKIRPLKSKITEVFEKLIKTCKKEVVNTHILMTLHPHDFLISAGLLVCQPTEELQEEVSVSAHASIIPESQASMLLNSHIEVPYSVNVTIFEIEKHRVSIFSYCFFREGVCAINKKNMSTHLSKAIISVGNQINRIGLKIFENL